MQQVAARMKNRLPKYSSQEVTYHPLRKKARILERPTSTQPVESSRREHGGNNPSPDADQVVLSELAPADSKVHHPQTRAGTGLVNNHLEN